MMRICSGGSMAVESLRAWYPSLRSRRKTARTIVVSITVPCGCYIHNNVYAGKDTVCRHAQRLVSNKAKSFYRMT